MKRVEREACRWSQAVLESRSTTPFASKVVTIATSGIIIWVDFPEINMFTKKRQD